MHACSRHEKIASEVVGGFEIAVEEMMVTVIKQAMIDARTWVLAGVERVIWLSGWRIDLVKASSLGGKADTVWKVEAASRVRVDRKAGITGIGRFGPKDLQDMNEIHSQVVCRKISRTTYVKYCVAGSRLGNPMMVKVGSSEGVTASTR